MVLAGTLPRMPAASGGTDGSGSANPIPLFGELYAQARERRYQVLEDQLVDLSDNAIHLDSMAQVQGRKLAVDTKKWIMSRRMPQLWGERISYDGPGAKAEVHVYLPAKGSGSDGGRLIEGQATVVEELLEG
jgi:hypothetical protein